MRSAESELAAKKAFAARLRAEMKRRDLSHRGLAERVDASKQSVTNWTQGTHEPSLRHVRRISEVLQVSIAELLGDQSRPDTPNREAAAIVSGLADLRLDQPIESLSRASPALLDLLDRAERQAGRTSPDSE